MANTRTNTRGFDLPLFIVGGLVLLSGIALAGAGGYLAGLGGSWYYLVAGIGMLIAGPLIMAGVRIGIWLYALVFIGTLGWTVWEAGLNYWRWVPRLDVVLVLGILVALVSRRVGEPFSRGFKWGVSGALVIALVVAGGLAFVPYGFTHPGQVPGANSVDVATDTGNVQAANNPAQGDWAAYGRDQAATRYSPTHQITAKNVADLGKVWQYQTGDRLDHRWGAETTPLKVGDSMYLCTSLGKVISLDAATGKQNWVYDAKVAKKNIPYTAACRGVTYYNVPQAKTASLPTGPDGQPACAARIVYGTQDARLIEVDARTGKLCRDFGRNGQLSIADHLGYNPAGYVAINSAPVIVNGVLITGHQTIDGQRRYAPSGVIKAYDAVTGEPAWVWDPGNPDVNTPMQGDGEYVRGSPDMWTTAVGDDKLDMIYLPMANASGDYWSGSRTPAMNKWATGVVALDASTGKPVWHFQTSHMDVWDYDPGSQPTLIDFPDSNGDKVPALMMPTKQGSIFVFNRQTGELLGGGATEKPVPQGGAEADLRTATQPYSNYATLQQPRLTDRDMWGISPFDQLYCRIQYSQARYDGMYTPPMANQPWIEYTGYNGGSDWGSLAIDTRRGVIIANYNDVPNYNRLVPRARANALGWVPREQQKVDKGGAEGAGDPQMGTPYAIDVNAGWRVPYTHMPCTEPPYGHIRAISLSSGKTLWDRPLGTARANGPFGLPTYMPINIGTPNNGGPAVTAGGLVFIAAATDNLIRAIDIETGKTVWSDVLPAGGQATPMVYSVNGREFVTIVATGHHFMQTPMGDYVVTYALASDDDDGQNTPQLSTGSDNGATPTSNPAADQPSNTLTPADVPGESAQGQIRADDSNAGSANAMSGRDTDRSEASDNATGGNDRSGNDRSASSPSPNRAAPGEATSADEMSDNDTRSAADANRAAPDANSADSADSADETSGDTAGQDGSDDTQQPAPGIDNDTTSAAPEARETAPTPAENTMSSGSNTTPLAPAEDHTTPSQH